MFSDKCFLVNFAKLLKTTFQSTHPYDCFWIEYKCNNTKMIQINIKHNNILPHFIQFNELLLKTTRSSHLQMFFKIGALKNFAIFTGKHPCWNNFIKKRLQLRFFPMNIARFLRTVILQNIFKLGSHQTRNDNI